MKRRTLIKGMATTLPSLWLSRELGNDFLPTEYLSEAIAKGSFKRLICVTVDSGYNVADRRNRSGLLELLRLLAGMSYSGNNNLFIFHQIGDSITV